MQKVVLAIVGICAAMWGSGADIYLAGDSTMCNYRKEQAPQQGWGQQLPQFCRDGVKVYNRAMGGRSVKSFRNEKRWEKLLMDAKEGDFVIIQFGHNDSNFKKKERYADYKTEFPQLLKACLDEAKAKKLQPILVTQTSYWGFNEDGTKVSNGSLQNYIDQVKKLAAEENVPLVDLNAIAVKKLPEIGKEETRKFYMMSVNGKDKLHLTGDGASAYAAWFVEGVKAQNLPLAELFQTKGR